MTAMRCHQPAVLVGRGCGAEWVCVPFVLGSTLACLQRHAELYLRISLPLPLYCRRQLGVQLRRQDG